MGARRAFVTSAGCALWAVGCGSGATSLPVGDASTPDVTADATTDVRADVARDVTVDAASDGTKLREAGLHKDATAKADTRPSEDGPARDAPPATDGAMPPDAVADAVAPGDARGDAPTDADTVEASHTDAALSCYAAPTPGSVHTMQANRDRLLADLGTRKCTDSCTLWAALSEAERYIFLMVTTYLGDTTSRLYPPGDGNFETALDHAVALYTVNGPDGTDRGGFDYNRIYLGFDPFAECVMRNFAEANPAQTAGYNEWVKSDDVMGPHTPFTQREMIFWYKTLWDLQSNGPQFHHWHSDSDFTQSGINGRLGVCGVTDRSLVELTIAFDFYHNSDPLGDYSGMGGYGWQIVSQYSSVDAGWDYTPTSCPETSPAGTDMYGGTYAGMGPSLEADACVESPIVDGGC